MPKARLPMPHTLVPALAVILLAANPQASPGPPEGPPTTPAIVSGHHIQPRGGGSLSDVPKSDAEEVDRLYQELMRQTAPDAGSNPQPPAPSRQP